MSRFFSPPPLFPEDRLACLCAEETRLLNLGGRKKKKKDRIEKRQK